MMTKQDFGLIANEIHAQWLAYPDDQHVLEKFARRLASAMVQEYPRFNESKFLLAAIEDGYV